MLLARQDAVYTGIIRAAQQRALLKLARKTNQEERLT
jgi:hypothetical protein